MAGLLDQIPAGQQLVFQQAARQYGVDPLTLMAIAATETGGTFNPKLTSRAGAMGLMQLMPSTARSLGVQNAYDPAQAIPAAAQGFSQLLGTYDRRMGQGWPALQNALRAYNNGPNPARWNNPQTQSYPGAFLNYYQQLRNEVSPPPPTEAQEPSADGLLGLLARGGDTYG